MTALAERSALRDQMPRAVDARGRRLFRGLIDTRALVRADEDGDGSIGFKGHAIVWNTRTWIGSKSWGFWEQIAPEAVTKTLQEADIRFLINHDPNLLLGRNTAGTLRLESDTTGLAVDADMADVSYARDLAVLLDRGDISQMSFAFEDVAWTYEEAEDGKPLYTLTEIRLFDVSVVTYPAYEETDAGLRSLAFEQLARSAGLTSSQSRSLARHLAAGEPIDDDIVAALRHVAPRAATTETDPTASTGERTDHPGPAEPTRDTSPPAGTTGTTTIQHLRRETLARRTKENG
jgi:HK97 family phage prohead protease